MNFEDIYRGFVIKEKQEGGYFVGPDSDMYRVTLRELAARFTKSEALEYIESGFFCKGKGEFVIEDAT